MAALKCYAHKKCPFPKHAQIKRVVKVVMTYGIAWRLELAVRPICVTNRSIYLDSEINASEQQQKKGSVTGKLNNTRQVRIPVPIERKSEALNRVRLLFMVPSNESYGE